jgi:hypothetical protein
MVIDPKSMLFVEHFNKFFFPCFMATSLLIFNITLHLPTELTGGHLMYEYFELKDKLCIKLSN